MLKISLLWIAVLCASTHAITVRDLYESSGPGSVTVPSADDESARIQLNSPVHFCTDTFDEVFVSSIFRIFPAKNFARFFIRSIDHQH